MRARIALGAALAAATVLLAGCGGSSDTTSAELVAPADTSMVGGAEMAPEAVGAPEARAEDGSATSSTAMQRQVVRSGSLSMRADDVAKTVAQVRGLASAAGGFVAAENTYAGDYAYSSITVQVPAAKLDGVIDAISKLGTIESVDVSAQDVTSQTVDLDARIKALQASVDRMTDLLAQASDVSDLMAIEAQLSQRQAELDALKAQRTWLGDQVAMSTLSVTVQPVSTIEPVDTPGFGGGLESGWAALVSAFAVAVTAVGFLLPFAILVAIVAVPVTIWAVWLVRRHRRQTLARVAELQSSDPTPTATPR